MSLFPKTSPSKSKGKSKSNTKSKAKKKDPSQSSSSSSSKSRDGPALEWLNSLKVIEVISPKCFDPSSIQSSLCPSPFPHVFLRDFIDSEMCRHLSGELEELEYFYKNNDLFELIQSNDLQTEGTPPITKKFREALYSAEFRHVMEDAFGLRQRGVEIGDAVDMAANVYQSGHHLLCHDDQLEGRIVAFIFYLVPTDWSEKDGGQLDLFDSQRDCDPPIPLNVSKSITPAWNSFIAFEVSPLSFHQVREVLAQREKRFRVTISGWFHLNKKKEDGAETKETGRTKRSPSVYSTFSNLQPADSNVLQSLSQLSSSSSSSSSSSPTPQSPSSSPSSLVDELVNREYRKPSVQKSVCKTFSNDSSIDLADFIRKDRYELLMKQVKEAVGRSEEWVEVGPPNRRHYYRWKPSGESKEGDSLIHSVCHFFTTDSFASLLKSLTSLRIDKYNGSVRLFRRGCFTNLIDEDELKQTELVDVQLCMVIPNEEGSEGDKEGKKKDPSQSKMSQWDPSFGGTVHYVEEGSTDELVSMTPQGNHLSIVYREGGGDSDGDDEKSPPGVSKFVKYMKYGCKGMRVDFNFSYRLAESEEDNEEEDKEEKQKRAAPPSNKKSKRK